MIGYLKGVVASIQRTGSRVILTLEVNQVGYDVQIVPRLAVQLSAMGEAVQILTHLQVREDQVLCSGLVQQQSAICFTR